jgi:hypothetical protein
MRLYLLTVRYLTTRQRRAIMGFGTPSSQAGRVPLSSHNGSGFGTDVRHRPIDTIRREHGKAVSQYRGALADLARLDRELAEHPENRRP